MPDGQQPCPRRSPPPPKDAKAVIRIRTVSRDLSERQYRLVMQHWKLESNPLEFTFWLCPLVAG